MTKPFTYRNQSKANLQNLKTSRNEIKNISPQLINSLSSIHFPDETIDTAMKPMAAAKLSQERYLVLNLDKITPLFKTVRDLDIEFRMGF